MSTTPVRSGRVAVVAGLLVTLYVIVTYTIVTVPGWTVAMFGGPDKPIDRIGGVRVSYRSAPNAPVQTFEYPGLAEEASNELLDILEHGGLAMKEALESNYAAQIGESEGVTFEMDMWRPDEGGETHSVGFLMSESKELLQRAIDDALERGFTLPSDAEIAFERVDPPQYRRDARPYWRTYLLSKEVLIDGSMIANATKSYDPYSSRPMVLLDFTEEGGDKFCEITARISGRKLATMLGGLVRSAPIINGRICGGRATVTMGGSDPEAQEREAAALVSVLTANNPIPAYAVLEERRYVPPTNVKRQEWMGRAMFGLIAGIAFGAIVFFAVRFARPVRVVRERVEGKFPWGRLAVTMLAPLSLIAGAQLTLPFLNDVELAHIMRRDMTTTESVIALGVTPVLLAFLIIEVVALAIPSLRWRRHDPRGRVVLGQAVAALAVTFALLQGWLVAGYYESMSRVGAEVLTDSGTNVKVMLAITMAAGTSLLVLVAGIIRDRGLGNGYAALFASTFFLDVAGAYLLEGFEGVPAYLKESGKGTVLGIIGAIGIAVGTRAMLRWRVGALRVPTSGIAPIGESAGLVFLIVMLSSFAFTNIAVFELVDKLNRVRTSITINLVMLLATIPVWAWLFARPKVVERVALQAGVDVPKRDVWLRATVLSFVGIGSIGVMGMHVAAVNNWAAGIAVPLSVMLATAALLDIVDDARARRRALAPAGVIHQVQYVGVVERVLADAGIPAHFHASNVRTLAAFFGPWAPVIVLVPEQFADTARTKVDDVLRAARAKVPEARVTASAYDATAAATSNRD